MLYLTAKESSLVTMSVAMTPKSSSLRAYRPLLLVVTVTLFAAVVIYVSLMTRQQVLLELQQKAEADLAQYRASLQQRLERYQSLPELLANSDLLRQAVSPAPANALVDRANRYLEQAAELVHALDIYVMAADGTTTAASNWKRETSFVGRNFSFRPYFTDAMAGQAGRYFALGSTTNKRGYYFSFPIQENETIIGAVVVKIDLDQIEERWNDPNTEIVVADEDGVVVISTEPEWMFQTLRPLTNEQMQRIVDSLRYGDQPLQSLNIVRRNRDPQGLELITLLSGNSLGDETLQEVEARQFFTIRTDLPDTGLEIQMLVSLKPLEERVLLAQALSAVIFFMVVLMITLTLQRRRNIRDRAQFKAREEQVRQENEARITGILNNTHAGLALIDTEGAIEYLNPVLQRLFGYRPEEMMGEPLYRLLAQQDQTLMQQYITREVSTREQNLRLEVDAVSADGKQFPVELTLNNMLLAGRYHLIVTLVDITERARHLQEMERIQGELEERVRSRTADLQAANLRLRSEIEQHNQTQNELVQAAKLAVLGQMSAGINHELNQPLTAIRNYADNAQRFLERDMPDKAGKNLSAIAALTERMARILHPLKEFARKRDGETSRVCLRDLRDGAMSILYGQLEKADVRVHWPQQLEHHWVEGDQLRLEQVVVNLLNNAMQAMSDSPTKELYVRLYDDEADILVLGFEDTGPGITPDVAQRVFEPFFTTKSQGLGLGLGLSISQRIVQSLNGELSLRSGAGGGAEFILKLRRSLTLQTVPTGADPA